MFDFHMHSRVSFDGSETGLDMAKAALAAGLKEICFTDHLDYDPLGQMGSMAFDTELYNAEYDNLELPGLVIRRGMEFGLTVDNRDQFKEDLKRRHFDFVLGSTHFVDGLDVYFPPYWQDKTIEQAERRYLEATLEVVKLHDDFDVLAHLTYIAKTTAHPAPRPVPFDTHREIVDEILRVLAAKGKGMELNTSGMDRCGAYLPAREYFQRFKELGGEIITIGSDAHQCHRVGQYAYDACDIFRDIFGYVCTFENRQPVFHKL